MNFRILIHLSTSFVLSFFIFSARVHTVELDFEDQKSEEKAVSYKRQISLDTTEEDQININIGKMTFLLSQFQKRKLVRASYKKKHNF